jgi:hypothetical protein
MIGAFVMAKVHLNANDEAEFKVSESYSNDDKSFTQIMQEIIPQAIKSKNLLSSYCPNENFEIKLELVDRCYHLGSKRKGV